ncbi:MAG: PEP-CTERM sorting domain-containing protein [Pirellulales bacterium]
MTSNAGAALIPVPNGDFETDAASRPGQVNGAPPSWTQTGVFGTFNVASTSYTNQSGNANYPAFQARGHGQLLAFAQGGATLSQTLTNLYLPDTTYSLSALVGDSYESMSAAGYEIRLLAGATVVASTTGTFPTTLLTVVTPSPVATFSTSTTPSAVGQPITIQIFAATGATKTFDNVTLDAVTATAVPEPGTWALFSMGLLGVVGYRLFR